MTKTPYKSGFITLLGLPNAGKSSLLNQLLGADLAIVTPKPQTTWVCMRGFVNRPEMQFAATDTPGIQEGTKALNQALANNAFQALIHAREGKELILFVVDAAELGRQLALKQSPTKLEIIKRVTERECGKLPLDIPVLPILNKADLVRKEQYRKEIEDEVNAFITEIFRNPEKAIWASRELNVENILNEIYRLLPEGKKGEIFEDEDALSDRNLRDFAADYIREQCFLQLGEEIPYSTAVQIDTFDETNPEIIRIEANLHVERESQKKVVIGKDGSKIKNIGIKSREKIERLLGKKVYLGLKVKTTPHWSREEQWVERFGYQERQGVRESFSSTVPVDRESEQEKF